MVGQVLLREDFRWEDLSEEHRNRLLTLAGLVQKKDREEIASNLMNQAYRTFTQAKAETGPNSEWNFADAQLALTDYCDEILRCRDEGILWES